MHRLNVVPKGHQGRNAICAEYLVWALKMFALGQKGHAFQMFVD
jgi:hypothetical protein